MLDTENGARTPLRRPPGPLVALALTAIIALVALFAPRLIQLPSGSFFPRSFVTHSVMLVLSLAAMWLLSKGSLDLYGLTKGVYQFSPRIFLWVLPIAMLSIISAVGSHSGQHNAGPLGLTKVQAVVFVWVYASVSEEMLTRGLLQTLLSGYNRVGSTACCGLSMPVLVSGLFFGSMHLVLIKAMGPAAIPVIVLAVLLGLVAARYREKTQSLIPAIIVHALFNIGGMLPLWVIQSLHG